MNCFVDDDAFMFTISFEPCLMNGLLEPHNPATIIKLAKIVK